MQLISNFPVSLLVKRRCLAQELESQLFLTTIMGSIIQLGDVECLVGRSEKPKSWKNKNGQADYLPRHSPDVRTVFEI